VPFILRLDLEKLAVGDPAETARFAAQMMDACYRALTGDGDGITVLFVAGQAVALLVPPETE
jgi:hypothetical protein